MIDRRFGLTARRRRSIDAIVRHVAEASADAVCRLVADRIQAMGLAEARGYVRARASAEVRRHARNVFAQQPGVDPMWETLIVLRAAERVSPLVLRRLSAQRTRPSRRHAA